LKSNIMDIFNKNIMLLEKIDKSICYFREQQHDIALGIIADSMELIRHSIEAIITNREYLNLDEVESVNKMLGGILEAYRMGDYVLLADLLELQLVSFIIGVQELIISKEEVTFSEEICHENLSLIKENSLGLKELSLVSTDPQTLLKEGYRVEFSSCGLMTLAAKNGDNTFYFHTNSRISYEAFLLARHWYDKKVKRYIIYGLGFGYHINELLSLTENTEIIIYEEDLNVIILASIFAKLQDIFTTGRVKLVYDPKLQELKNTVKSLQENDAFYVHYPSYLNIRSKEGRKLLTNHVSWVRFD
jgi:hypothetical protein